MMKSRRPKTASQHRHTPLRDPAGNGLPHGIGAPAARALAAAGITRLEQLTSCSEAELLRLHGVGPKAIRLLRAALSERRLKFAPEKDSRRVSDRAHASLPRRPRKG